MNQEPRCAEAAAQVHGEVALEAETASLPPDRRLAIVVRVTGGKVTDG
jgi:hypothetical protein